MRIRIRGPGGVSTVSLDGAATVSDLKASITEKTGLMSFTIKSGYPPQPLELPLDVTTTLNNIGINLDGEQLIIAAMGGNVSSRERRPASPSKNKSNTLSQPSQPLALERKTRDVSNDPPELPFDTHSGTLVLRVMPDDNSCLFRAIGTAVFGVNQDAMGDLRNMVSAGIQSQPETYSEAVLQRSPEAYCDWIQHPDSWGGAIEMGILSQSLGIEICSVSVQDQRIDRFNEGAPRRCVLVYSGIHYDVIALNPSSPPFDKADMPAEVDITIFEGYDDEVLIRAQELCQVLQKRGYFTDTAKFDIQCNVCKWKGNGEQAATQHATETGHMNFGET
ncbi:zinc finger protein [Eremomyces bilateralis CBS 781.70]|uniref:Ubiquitin thioesterase OTU n=1 Tax=Eremomyces bilateralis CBS 781.70 TaxID=1392243 RepID=A0A6G1FRQ7_9PEZI|nr:zinc finger protein [Eremomyces bilateralis CBS 781.70]KAF1808352.1 zinc finger protein [Eremomyces bilateralis CBS 781.70]